LDLTIRPVQFPGATSVPESDAYIEYLSAAEPFVIALLDLRNGQDHPAPGSETVIENFKVTGALTIGPPTWRRLPSEPRPIMEDMINIVPILIEFAETNFIYGLLANIDFPMTATEIPEEARDPNCPIRYRLLPAIVRQK
jgi:hypothetical protein